MNRPPGQRDVAAKSPRLTPLLAALVCISVGPAHAIGFGRLPSTAVLGQQLELGIPIRLDDGEALSVECISAEVMFGDNRQQPGVVNLALDPALPNATERMLRLVTNSRVDEPFVTVELSLGCQSKAVRRFTLFADPPSFTPPAGLASSEPAALRAEPASAPANAAQLAASTASVDAAATAARSTPPRRATTSTRQRQTVAAASATPARTTPRRPAAQAAAGPRLQLTPLAASDLLPTRAPADAAAIAAAEAEAAASEAAAKVAASAAALAEQDRARVQQLEASLQALRTETAQTQQAMRGLQARMQAAQDERYANPLVFALLAICGLLALALAWLWRLRAQDREAAAWMHSAGSAHKDVDTAEAIAFEQQAMPAPAAAVEPVPDAPARRTRAGEFDAESTEVLPGPPPPPTTLSAPSVLALEAGEPARRAVSAEELIDLEQQAEFFIVLGQEEAAIDLLMGHLRSTAGTSPLPYLKLLELYRKRGNRREYERVRERFNIRFSAYAPEWDVDLNDGRALEDYPSVIGRLQTLWPTPARALEVLQLTLARPEGDPHAGDSFELPAYRELVLLYSVARELAEEEPLDTRSVDLLLPLDGIEPISLEWQAPVLERLTATAAVSPQPGARSALHVDLPLDLVPPSPSEAAAAPAGFRSTTVDDAIDDGTPSEAGRRG